LYVQSVVRRAARMRHRPWVAGLRLPLLRCRARPLAKLAAADKTGSVVGHRQRKTPVTAPRGGGSQGPTPHPARQPWISGTRLNVVLTGLARLYAQGPVKWRIWPLTRKQVTLEAARLRNVSAVNVAFEHGIHFFF
jgi:hypothetical protein